MRRMRMSPNGPLKNAASWRATRDRRRSPTRAVARGPDSDATAPRDKAERVLARPVGRRVPPLFQRTAKRKKRAP